MKRNLTTFIILTLITFCVIISVSDASSHENLAPFVGLNSRSLTKLAHNSGETAMTIREGMSLETAQSSGEESGKTPSDESLKKDDASSPAAEKSPTESKASPEGAEGEKSPANAEKGEPTIEKTGEEKPSSEKTNNGKKEEKKGIPNISTFQIVLIIIAPIFIIVLFFVLNYIRGKIVKEADDDSTAAPRAKMKKPVKRRESRLQVPLSLIKHWEIARLGSLQTDFHFKSARGANKGETFKINKYVSTIGRRSTDGRLNDIELSSLEKKLSRKQGLLVYKEDEDTFYLINESANRIYVNKDKVTEAYPLRDGDRIITASGDVELIFAQKIYEVK